MPLEYQPFAITQSKTGLFNYVEPWMRPEDAYDPLSNAYVYRGSIYKRKGLTLYGRMTYKDSPIIATGNGGASYSGTLSSFPITSGSMTVKVKSSAGLETFTDNGSGTLTGSLGDSGTINYTTGAWTLTFSGGRTVGAGVNIVGSYTYIPNQLTTPVNLPIMGINQFIDDFSDTKKIVICDTRRAAVFNSITTQFTPLSTVSQTLWVDDGATASSTFSIGWTNLAPYSVTISYPGNSMTDNGDGTFPGAGVMLNTSTVNYTTGSVTLNLSANSKGRIFTIAFTLQGDYFSGDNTNFFNFTNWLGNLYLTNNHDLITLFDGTNLSRPPFAVTQAHATSFTNDIVSCIDVKVYKNRLLFLRAVVSPAISGINPGQSIRYSAINNPTNFVADVTGNGGEISAPTGDWIQGSEFLRDILVVFFERSTWSFRFTGNAFDPFRWDKINVSKTTQAPYAITPYDDRVTSIGDRGLVYCDGVNVERYDLSIVDQFDDINQEKFGQCFTQRFDQLNQTWMLYPSVENNSSTSDKALVYNFIEKTWSTYNISLSCLGLGISLDDAKWSDFGPGGIYYSEYPNWGSCDFAWDSYLVQAASEVLLGGDFSGNVFIVNDGDTDNGTSISSSVTTKRWNPFVEMGQRVQIGYIDFYYQKSTASPTAALTLNFLVDNSTNFAITKTLTMDGPSNATVAWKRIPLNLIGEFVQLNLADPGNTQPFKILGMILWAKPSGRLTP